MRRRFDGGVLTKAASSASTSSSSNSSSSSYGADDLNHKSAIGLQACDFQGLPLAMFKAMFVAMFVAMIEP